MPFYFQHITSESFHISEIPFSYRNRSFVGVWTEEEDHRLVTKIRVTEGVAWGADSDHKVWLGDSEKPVDTYKSTWLTVSPFELVFVFFPVCFS